MPQSLKREMNLLYYLALAFFKQEKYEEFNVALVVYEEMYKRYQWIKLGKQRRSPLNDKNFTDFQGANASLGESYQLNYESPSF